MSVHVITASRHGSTAEIGEAIAARLEVLALQDAERRREPGSAGA